MDHQVLVGVMDGRADSAEELQAFDGGKLAGIAVLEERLALDILHHEVGKTVFGGAAVEKPCDVGVVQGGQNLPLILESAKNALAVHPPLDELDGDSLAVLLVGAVGFVHGPHPAVANLANKLVGANSAGSQLISSQRNRRAVQLLRVSCR